MYGFARLYRLPLRERHAESSCPTSYMEILVLQTTICIQKSVLQYGNAVHGIVLRLYGAFEKFVVDWGT